MLIDLETFDVKDILDTIENEEAFMIKIEEAKVLIDNE